MEIQVSHGSRPALLNDKKGQLTGIPGKYTENTLYATKYIDNAIMLRPELALRSLVGRARV